MRASCLDCETRLSSSKVALLLLIVLVLSVAAGADAGVLISVDASPLSIPADGKSHSQILVTVFDQTGAPVPDGTEVRLSASAGDITPAIYTSGGRAVGVLTSSANPQVAIIEAIADGMSAAAQVEFASSEYEQVPAAARTIHMEGGSLAYSVDQDTMIGSNSVTIEYRGLTIQATSAQVCQIFGQIRAQGDVTIRKGEQTLTADALAIDTGTERVRLIDLGDQPNIRTYDMGKLKQIGEGTAPANADEFSPLINTDSRSWIISERSVLIPGQKILFYKASVYVGDAKILAMPYYAYSYETRSSILQQVRYSSSEGMLVDLPFYYRMTASGSGAIKLRYAADGTDTGSFYRPRKGISIGLEQDYAISDRSQGRLFVDSLWSSSLAFELAHHLEYGSVVNGGRADFSARYQPSSDYAKNAYNATLSVAGGLGKYDYTISGYLGGSSIELYDYEDPERMDYLDQSNGSIKAIFQPKTPIAAGSLGRLIPSVAVGYGDLWDASGGPVSSSFYETLGLSTNRSKPLSRSASFAFDSSVGWTATADGESGTSLRLRPSLRCHWMGGSASLSYTLNLQDGTTDSVSSLSKHLLGCSLFMTVGGKWSVHTSANYGLDSGRLTLYSGLNYRLADYWQIRSSYNLYRYAYELNEGRYSYDHSYLKVGVYHPIGSYEIGLAWSPNGQYYGMNKDRRVWLELGSSGF